MSRQRVQTWESVSGYPRSMRARMLRSQTAVAVFEYANQNLGRKSVDRCHTSPLGLGLDRRCAIAGFRDIFRTGNGVHGASISVHTSSAQRYRRRVTLYITPYKRLSSYTRGQQCQAHKITFHVANDVVRHLRIFEYRPTQAAHTK
ncbi:hypothetical protein AG1IA_06607 [Rhizoctonia solani AG-1 IA]|uniref:Uncharacterized protein n=1 Tax=Thanatephorus cucumeris (strain AG1-IA) TaxID=983506 RepID=L8WSK7_THACA|nr:hypothetical protein AG1IA_06607 [Rhizoctonia solani AG-1 IA]